MNYFELEVYVSPNSMKFYLNLTEEIPKPNDHFDTMKYLIESLLENASKVRTYRSRSLFIIDLEDNWNITLGEVNTGPHPIVTISRENHPDLTIKSDIQVVKDIIFTRIKSIDGILHNS